jgi:hypothetical protein
MYQDCPCKLFTAYAYDSSVPSRSWTIWYLTQGRRPCFCALTRCIRSGNIPSRKTMWSGPFFFSRLVQLNPSPSVCLEIPQPWHQTDDIQSLAHIVAQRLHARGRGLPTWYQPVLVLEGSNCKISQVVRCWPASLVTRPFAAIPEAPCASDGYGLAR